MHATQDNLVSRNAVRCAAHKPLTRESESPNANTVTLYRYHHVRIQSISSVQAAGPLGPGAASASFLLDPPCCAGPSSALSLLERPLKTSLSLALMRLFLLSRAPSTSSVLAFALPPAISPLWFLRCSLRRRRADIRSSGEAFGR